MLETETLIRFPPPPPILKEKTPMILGLCHFVKTKKTKCLYRIFPLAREANTPPRQRTAKKVKAVFMHLKKSG
jgi:hypothetical protein